MSGAGTKNRPPIARNPAIGVNGGGVHNIGGVNTELQFKLRRRRNTGTAINRKSADQYITRRRYGQKQKHIA